MAKKSPRFVENFMADYMGGTLEQFAANLPRQMGRAVEFHRMCNSDLDFAMNLLKSQDTQEARRVFIRTLPPYVEGTLNFLRVITYMYPPLLSRLPADCSVDFLEPMVELRNRSTIRDSVRNTLVGFGQVAGLPIPTDVMGQSGAQALMAVFDLRDSLMHPRSIDGFTVTDAQIAGAHTGHLWYLRTFASLFTPLIATVQRMSENP